MPNSQPTSIRLTIQRSTLAIVVTMALTGIGTATTFLVGYGQHQEKDRQQTVEVQVLKDDQKATREQLTALVKLVAELTVSVQDIAANQVDDAYSSREAWRKLG